jgi:hypothetical protein
VTGVFDDYSKTLFELGTSLVQIENQIKLTGETGNVTTTDPLIGFISVTPTSGIEALNYTHLYTGQLFYTPINSGVMHNFI